ncbi:MAG: hypothetical protein PWQ67_466 [Clostridia bacterium]|jgi:hypothetical protein|nr:hypothetical protein [Clostridia bacterium]MDN5322012.1 hypothetical protein [Clostridia bacterium]
MLLDITQLEKEIYYQKLKELLKEMGHNFCVGFWGQPDQKTMDILVENNYHFIDLDVPQNYFKTGYIPTTTCHIIQDIISNAFILKDKLDFFIATTGNDKCEQGYNVARILADEGFPVINATNTNNNPIRPCLISNAAIPLKTRVARIMELTYKPLTKEEEAYYASHQITVPAFIFHGVPPRDLSILDNFPLNTRIEGWTKLVELGIPGRQDLEWQISTDIPTVFFTQSFCHKELLAAYWARQIGGLHIEAHNTITHSTEAKLQAYLGLAGQIFIKE